MRTHGPPSAVLAALIATALAAAPLAQAQEPEHSPFARELWRAYPLHASPEPGAAPSPPGAVGAPDAQPVPPGAAGAPDAQPAPASAGGARDGGGGPWALVAVLVVAAGGAVLFWDRRRRRSEAFPEAPADRPTDVERVLKPWLAPALRDAAPLLWAPVARAVPATGAPRAPRADAARSGGGRASDESEAHEPDEAGRGDLLPPDPERTWTAEIGWQESDDGWRFRVLAREDDASPAGEIGASPPLEWPPAGPAAVEALASAAASLERSLLAAGWQPLPPGSSWYAKRFAWEPAAVADLPSGDPVGPSGWPVGAEDLWRCEIAWSPGYATSRFRALARPPGGGARRPVAESTRFKWLLRSDPDLRSPEQRAEVRRLATALAGAGWERAGRGSGWYAARFVWRGADAPPERIELGPAESERDA